MSEKYEQPELPLEWATYDHYTVEIRRGPLFDEQAIRTHRAESRDDALNLIEGMRDTYGQRENVTWQAEEVDGVGKLYGLAPGGEVYVISVIPPLTTELS